MTTESRTTHGTWSIRVKDDGLSLRIGNDVCYIQVLDGQSDEAAMLTKTIHEKTQTFLKLRRTASDRAHAAARKAMKEDVKRLDILGNAMNRSLKQVA